MNLTIAIKSYRESNGINIIKCSVQCADPHFVNFFTHVLR